jgi:hypothetical protein
MKIKSIIILNILIVFLLSACKFEESNLFDKSAAERLAEAQVEYKQVLCNATNGWKFNYFPDSEHQGYNFVMKFYPSGEVKMTAKNSLTANVVKRDSCAFEIIADNGPVLSFNTYSDAGVFHVFADPIESEGGEQGKGYNGDYEFIVISATAEKVVLKGKKRGLYFDLYPLAENLTWNEYFTNLDAQRDFLFDTRVDLQLKHGGEVKYNLLKSTTSVFDYLAPGGDPILNTKQLPFITTDNGIRLPALFEVADKINVRTFEFNADKSKLISIEDETVTIEAPELSEFLSTSRSNFLATKENTTGIDAIFDQLKVAFVAGFNNADSYELASMGFVGYDASTNGIKKAAFIFKTKGGTSGYFAIPITYSNGKAIIENFDINDIPAGNMSNNARNFYQRVPLVKTMLALLPGTYNLETTNKFAIRTVKYTKSDNTLSFTTSRNKNQ